MPTPAALRDELVRRLEAHDRSDLPARELPAVWSWPASGPGVATALVVGSLTLLPSMLPKNALMQGFVLGVNFVVGYALGAAWQAMWRFLELPSPHGHRWRVVVRGWYGALAVVLTVILWHHVGWQNDMRRELGMVATAPTVWLGVLPVALVVALALLVVARSVRRVVDVVVRWFDRHLPRRLAQFLGGAAVVLLLWGLWTEVLVDASFALANRLSAPVDDSTDEGIEQPTSALRSGSSASLVAWETLGRQGRRFVASGPTVEEIETFSGPGAVQPVRVYVGLRSAPTVQARAELVLDELVRTGAFEREVLVVATTTGTGLVGPTATDGLEYMLGGDVAVAAAQYSYLPSAISLLADIDEVRETADAVFETVHRHWSRLPADTRPAIYLYGLSLGSHGVESILTSIDIVNEPIDGALLVGPPFFNRLRGELVADREPDSTAVAPVYEDGATVRFTLDGEVLEPSDRPWGDTRILYLQHATDPVVFFTPDLLADQPAWLHDRDRDASFNDGFRWIPIVTMWQVLTDMAVAGSVPPGHGHLYTASEHAAAWAAIVDRGTAWSASDTAALQRHLAASEDGSSG